MVVRLGPMFATLCATSMVSLDAVGLATALSSSGSLEAASGTAGAMEKQHNTLMRSQERLALDALSTPLVGPAGGMKALTATAHLDTDHELPNGPMHWARQDNTKQGEDEPPCDPKALAAYLEVMGSPEPGGQKAATLGNKAHKDDSPCAKLAKSITPRLAHGHVIIKEPDGNTSQVPEQDETRESHVQKLAKNNLIWYMVNSIFWVFVLCSVVGICVQRSSQDSTAKRIKKEREAAANAEIGADVDIAEHVEAMVKSGASAGAIAAVHKAAAKAEASRSSGEAAA